MPLEPGPLPNGCVEYVPNLRYIDPVMRSRSCRLSANTASFGLRWIALSLRVLLVACLTVIMTTCVNPVWLEHSTYAAPAALRPANFDSDLQWNMEMINAPGAWGIMESLVTNGTTLHPVVVAVLDTRVAEHDDLVSQLLDELNIVDDNGGNVGPGIPDNQHGTHVSGIIAAAGDPSGDGLIGVAGSFVSLLPVRVLDLEGQGTTGDLTRGIWAAVEYLETVGAMRVINLSLGGGSTDAALYDAIAYARGRGVTIIAAGGNSGEEGLLVPAFFDNTIAVTAVTATGSRASYSNFGSGVSLAAPGGAGYYSDQPLDSPGTTAWDAVLSTWETDKYRWLSGTSMATPHVAGIAALLYAVEPGLNQDAVYSILRATARDLGTPGWDKYYGHGLVDAQAALEYLLNLQQRIPRAPMGADDSGAAGGISIQTSALSGAQYPEAESDIDSHSVILRFHEGQAPVTGPELFRFEARLRQRFGVASAQRIGAHTMVVKLGAGQQPLDMLEPLAALDEVQYSQPNYRYQAIR